MAKLTFLYTVFCLTIIHSAFVLTENSDQFIQGVSKSTLLSNDQNNFYNQNSIPNYDANGKQNAGSNFRSTEEAKLQSAQNIYKQYENAVLNNSSNTNRESDVDNSQIELPKLFLDFESLKRSKDTVINDLMTTGHTNKNTESTPVTSEPGNTVQENENTPNDEIDTATSQYNDHNDRGSLWNPEANEDDDEDYEDNKDNEIYKKDQINGSPGIYDNDVDDDDEEYSVTKWAEHDNSDGDEYSDKDYEDENDGDDNGLEESKNLSADDNVDDDLPRRSKQPTAPTSMVLFYTWMIIAVIIIIVAISTYQSRCKNIRFPWKRTAAKLKDDHKRLIEHEFV